MKRLFIASVLGTAMFAATSAQASPRDATAVLARCGHPLKGDQTILENTVAGGRRLLMYERGTLHFDKVTTQGWTFMYGTHQKLDNLTAEQMQKYMPCLKDALAMAAADEPIKKMPTMQRIENAAEVQHPYRMIVGYIAGVLVLAIGFIVWITRKDDQVEEPTV